MQDLSRFVPNVHFEQIPIKNLVSNQEYQRPLSQAQVEKAIEDFDLNQINPVKVSRRDGINYVFNAVGPSAPPIIDTACSVQYFD